MAQELKELQNEFNMLADSYFASPEDKHKWLKTKNKMVFGEKTPSELYATKCGVLALIQELYRLRSGNLA